MSINLSHQQRRILAYSIPVLAVFAALIFGAIMLVLLGANPIEGYSEMFVGAFGSGDALIATILKAWRLHSDQRSLERTRRVIRRAHTLDRDIVRQPVRRQHPEAHHGA